MSNQSPPFVDVDLFRIFPALAPGLAAAGHGAAFEGLSAFGRRWGAAESFELGRLANERPPVFRPFDPRGERIDNVEFHPAYHDLMRRSLAAGLHASTWQGEPHALRAARLFIAYPVESGHICPVTMTHASLAALAWEPEAEAAWRPKVLSRDYDPRPIPWTSKTSVTLGMAMTELQGGSDLKANETRAIRTSDGYLVQGAKWFMSAPMSDAFLTLAQTDRGPTCFLVPRLRADGTLNGVTLQRLKDKLGNRSNASSEAVFDRALGRRIGEEGRGLRTILAMAHMTRLDCAVASAALIGFGVAYVAHHARNRRAFGRLLIDHPAYRATLADLALESEAATALAVRLAHAFDGSARDEGERAYARIVTPAAKFLICKAAPSVLAECVEGLGGNGYVEDWPLARAFREAPVNGIWEGSGSIMALDVLRAARQDPAAAQAIADKLVREEPDLREVLAQADERGARRAAERLARAAASQALRAVAPDLADAYDRTRRGGKSAAIWGACDLSDVEDALIERLEGHLRPA